MNVGNVGDKKNPIQVPAKPAPVLVARADTEREPRAAQSTTLASLAPVDERPPGTSKVAAFVYLKGGNYITIKENDFESSEKNIPRAEYLANRYGELQAFFSRCEIHARTNHTRILGREITDLPLKFLAELDNTQLDKKGIAKLEGHLGYWSIGRIDKPALMFIMAQALLAKGKISITEFESRVEKVIELEPDELFYYKAYARSCLARGRVALAVRIFGKFLKTKNSLSEFEAGLEGVALAGVMAKKGSDGGLLNIYGNHLMLWALSKNEPKEKKRILLAAEKVFLRALSLVTTPAVRAASFTKLAEINLAFASLSQEILYVEAAVCHLENAVDLLPANTELLLKTGDAYNLRAALKGEEADLKKARDYYKRAVGSTELLAEKRVLWEKLSATYAQLDEFDKARQVFLKAIKQYPDDYELYILLANILVTQGRFDEAIKVYRIAFAKAKAQKIGDPSLAYRQVYQNLFMLRLQKRMELAKLDIRYAPNILKMLLRMVGDLLYFANPVNIVNHCLYYKRRPYARRDLAEFLVKLDALEEESWQSFNFGHDVAFLASNLSSLSQLEEGIQKTLEESKDEPVHPEIIQGYLELKEYVASRVEINLGRIPYNSDREKIWQAAVKTKDVDQVLPLLADCFASFSAAVLLLPGADLSEALEERYIEAAEKLWETLQERIAQANKLAEQQKDYRPIYAVLNQAAPLTRSLEGLPQNDLAEELDLADKKKALRGYYEAGLKKVAAMAKDKKDYVTLLELSENYEHMAEIAFGSLKAARDLAVKEKNHQQLKQVADRAFSLASKAKSNSAPQSRAYRQLAVSAYESLLGLYQRSDETYQANISKYYLAAVQLWRLGEYAKTTAAFQFMLEKADADDKVALLAQLGYLFLARDDKAEAKNYFQRALALSPQNSQIAGELDLLERPELLQGAIRFEGNELLPDHIFWALFQLYSLWMDDDALEDFAQGIKEVYQAHGYQVGVEFDWDDLNGRHVVTINEHRLEKIEIVTVARMPLSFIDTEREAILSALAIAGLKPGQPYKREEIEEAITAASIHLNKSTSSTFIPVDWHLTEGEEGMVLELDIVEKSSTYLFAGGGAGNISANVMFDGGVGNLFGGGEALGVKFDYSWFYSGGYSNYEFWGGRLYYRDPTLLLIDEKYPVSLEVSADRFPRPVFETEELEIVEGGQMKLGFHPTPRTEISLAPSLYSVSPQTNEADYFNLALGLGFNYNGTNDALFPSSGYFASAQVTPGFRFGGNLSEWSLRAGGEIRKYFSLPKGTHIMLGMKAAASINPAGGNALSLANYVRGEGDNKKIGDAVVAWTFEFGLPVANLGEYGELGKLQTRLYADLGLAIKFGSGVTPGFGVGIAQDFYLPLISKITFYIGFPGGFGIIPGAPPIF
ncbi:tetratricopeptide repeat protein [Candidatus Margulisiibacteriota bacterium]